jgi:N-acetylneuraminate synthase
MYNNIEYKKPIIVAEVGCNHKGSFDIAKNYIETISKDCDIIKFQKRHNRTLLTQEQYNSHHPNLCNSYGDTYGEHREFLEFDIEQHKQLMKLCEGLNIIYSTSVWDLISAKEIISLNPKLIKIPSASNNNFEMLKYICDNFNGEIHVSTGMTTKEEIENIVNLFENKNRNKDLILYSCVSGYPLMYNQIYLLDIVYLIDKYKNRVKNIGFSGHHIGVFIDIAAYTLGANIIERHITLNKGWKGTDHLSSIEPIELNELKHNLNNTYKALKYKPNILDIEKSQIKKLKYRDKNNG